MTTEALASRHDQLTMFIELLSNKLSDHFLVARILELPSSPEISFESPLRMIGTTSGTMKRAPKPRYIVCAGKALYAFKDINDRIPEATMVLADVQVESRPSTPHLEHAFDVIHRTASGKSSICWTLDAPDDDERTHWIKVIEKEIIASEAAVEDVVVEPELKPSAWEEELIVFEETADTVSVSMETEYEREFDPKPALKCDSETKARLVQAFNDVGGGSERLSPALIATALSRAGLEVDPWTVEEACIHNETAEKGMKIDDFVQFVAELALIGRQFDSIDPDREDEIEIRELGRAFDVVGFDFHPALIEAAADYLDASATGIISLDNFAAVYYFLRHLWKEYEVALDRSLDGRLVAKDGINRILESVGLDSDRINELELPTPFKIELQSQSVSFSCISAIALGVHALKWQEEDNFSDTVTAPFIDESTKHSPEEVVGLLDPENTGQVSVSSIGEGLMLLGFRFGSAAVNDIILYVDPEQTGAISHEVFFSMAKYMIHVRDTLPPALDGGLSTHDAREFIQKTEPSWTSLKPSISLNRIIDPDDTGVVVLESMCRVLAVLKFLKHVFSKTDSGTGHVNGSTVLPGLCRRMSVRSLGNDLLDDQLDYASLVEVVLSLRQKQVDGVAEQGDGKIKVDGYVRVTEYSSSLLAVASAPLPGSTFDHCTVTLYDATTLERREMLPTVFQGTVRSLQFSIDGTLLAVVTWVPSMLASERSDDMGVVMLNVWDVGVSPPVPLLLHVRQMEHCVTRAWSRMANQWLDFGMPHTSSSNKTFGWLDRMRSKDKDIDPCTLVCFIAGNERVVVCDARKGTRISSLIDRVTMEGKMPPKIEAVKFFCKHDDSRIAVANGVSVRVWNYASGEVEFTIPHPTMSMAINDKVIACIGSGERLALFSIADKKTVKTLLPGYRVVPEGERDEDTAQQAPQVSFLPGSAGQLGVVSGSRDGCIWAFANPKTPKETSTVAAVESSWRITKFKRSDPAPLSSGLVSRDKAGLGPATVFQMEKMKARLMLPALTAEANQVVLPFPGVIQYLEFSLDGRTALLTSMPQGSKVELSVRCAVTGELQWNKTIEHHNVAVPARLSIDARAVLVANGDHIRVHNLPPIGPPPLPIHNSIPLIRQEIMVAVAESKKRDLNSLLKKNRQHLNWISEVHRLSPLMLAIPTGDFKLVNKLIQLGADPTLVREDGLSALHIAGMGVGIGVLISTAMEQQTKIVERLIEVGADVNGKWTSHDDVTALHIAVSCGFLGVVKAIMNKAEGLDKDAETNSGKNVLVTAVENEASASLVEYLLDHGFSADQRLRSGSTVLHRAVKQDNRQMVKLLLKKGANAETPDSTGKTLFEWSDGLDLARKHIPKKLWPEKFKESRRKK